MILEPLKLEELINIFDETAIRVLNYYMKKASSRYTSPCKCFCYSSYSLSLILPLNKYKLLLRHLLTETISI